MNTPEKIGVATLIGISLFFLITGNVWAAVRHDGNLTVPAPIPAGYQISGPAGAGASIQGLTQTFSLTQSIVPSSLGVLIARNGATETGTYTVTLCVYYDLSAADPCVNNPIKTWTAAVSTLPVYSTGLTAAAETQLPMDGITLYSSTPYAIFLSRSTQVGNIRWASTTSGYSSGNLYFKIAGCPSSPPVPPWQQNNNSGTCGSVTVPDSDGIFDLFGGSGALLTVKANQNGPEVRFTGFCVRPEDQPDSWILNSNLVDLHIEDITSGTGTNVLYQANCDPTQGTYTSGNIITLWNGNFKVTASQFGDPNTYTATTEFTVSGSTKNNPSGFLTLCQSFELTDTLSLSALKSSVGCSISAFAYNITDVAPFSWHRQVTDALTSSGTSSIQIGIPIPAALADGWTESSGTHDFDMLSPPPATVTAVNIFDSSTNTGIANKVAEKFPFLRTFAVMFLWLELGLWLAGLIWIVIPLL